MKYLISALLSVALLFSLTSCKSDSDIKVEDSTPIQSNAQDGLSSKPNDSTINWELKYYVDEFKEPTEEWYITNSEPFRGEFSNTATEGSEVAVILLIDQEVLSIVLYEYGTNQVKNIFYNDDIDYNITVRLPDGTDYETTGFMYGKNKAGDRIFIESPGKDDILEALQGTGELKFIVQDTSDSFTQYLFTVQASNFSEVYKTVEAA